MNKSKESEHHKISSSTEYWNHSLVKILDQSLLNEVIKFHQSTSVIKRENQSNPYSLDALQWLNDIENTDVLPNMYISEHTLDDFDYYNIGSERDFNLDEELSYSILSSVIQKAFGRFGESTSKRHPSAGGLYPVIPLVCILKSYPDALLTRGVYVYDSYRNSLKKIKEWNNKDYDDFIGALASWGGTIPSNYLMGYAIDMKRATAKYKKRGYRHALIEIGTMLQSFKESLIEEKQELGEFCSSGFDDNAVTYHMGLNPRTCPVTLIQWFGKRQ